MVAQIQAKMFVWDFTKELTPILIAPSIYILTLTSTYFTWEEDHEAFGWLDPKLDFSVEVWPIEEIPNASRISKQTGNLQMEQDGLKILCSKLFAKKIIQVRYFPIFDQNV